MADGVRCMLMRGGSSKGAYFVRDDLPEVLYEAVDRATATDPSARYSTAGGMAESLNSMLIDTNETRERDELSRVVVNVRGWREARGVVPDEEDESRPRYEETRSIPRHSPREKMDLLEEEFDRYAV